MVKQVPGDNHEVRVEFDSFVHELFEGAVEILPSHFQAVLGVAQVQVCGMNKTERFQIVILS